MPLAGLSPFSLDLSAIRSDSTLYAAAFCELIGAARVGSVVDVSDIDGMGAGWLEALADPYQEPVVVDPVVDVDLADLTGLGSGWSTVLAAAYVASTVTLSDATAVTSEVVTSYRTLTVGGVSFKVAVLE
jgi:hypothetical protein